VKIPREIKLIKNLTIDEYNKIYYQKNKKKLVNRSRKYRINNEASLKEKAKKYRIKNKERINNYILQYRLNNKTKISKTTKSYYLKNLHIFKAINAKRRATKLKATPKFANLNKIKEIYNNCPKGFHVDHIVPLTSKLVCGLHVEWNLQYLPAKENLSKSNKLM
jgi:hypothetical protein